MTAPGRIFLSIFFAFLLLPAPPAGAQTPPEPSRQITVKDLVVEGNRRIQEAVIVGRVGTKVGSPFSPNRLAEDIRAIFALGYFDDVQLKVEDFEGGLKVTFIVVERPFVRDVQFAGNKKLDTATLTEKIDLKLGAVYNPVEVTRAAEKLKDFYEEEGYFEVQVTPDATKLPDGDVAVTFRIAEGRKITIEEIVVEGAKGLTPKQIKAVMATQERQYYILRGTVERQKLDDDRDRIVALYNDHGYIQARVESADAIVDKERARVTIRIVVVEGPQFTVGGIDITGNNVVPVEEIRRRIPFKTGDVFSRSKVRDSIAGIQALYGTIGRASADVNPQSSQDTANRRINLTYEINEGPEVFVERINITGNTRSQEKILRREIPMHEGDFYTSAKLERARQRLNNLGYFEQVKATTSPGSAKDKIIVNIEVTERPTGLFSIGGGYSSADSFIATLDLSQRNFLGRGWELFLRVRAGAADPAGHHRLHRALALRPAAVRRLRSLQQPPDLQRLHRQFPGRRRPLRASARRLLPLEPHLPHHPGRHQRPRRQRQLQPPGARKGSASPPSWAAAVTRDTRDSAFEPTRGSIASVGADFAGVGFGDSKFVRGLVNIASFYNIWLDHVISGRAQGAYMVGWSKDPVPLFERFYLGGANSLRGFKARQVSPVDGSGTRVGGTIQLLGNVEYTVPLFFGVRAAVFYDVGQVYGPDTSFGTTFDLGDLRHNAGLSLRWASPFGPLRIDYGIKLDRRKDESMGEFQFSVGAPF